MIPAVALLGALLADGLGYLYVGRPRWAIALWLSRTALICGLAWCRILVRTGGFYALIALALVLSVFVPLHAAWYAQRHRVQPRAGYNRWWVYALWIAAAWGGNALLAQHRAQWLGFESYHIASTSMSPTLDPGDFVIVDTWRYPSESLQVGDVVAFRLPTEPAVFLKRVVALPGDHVVVRDGGAVRNGAPLTEPYLHAPLAEPYSRRDFAYQPALEPGEYFVLGDRRDNSKDSRNWGPIEQAWIIGRVEYRWLSLDALALQAGRFPHSLAGELR